MWKWIVLAVAAYALYRLFANDIKRKFGLGKGAEGDKAASVDTDMVKDPECGAYVSADSIITVRDGEKVWHFCSYDCRDRFIKRLQSGGTELNASADREKTGGKAG